MPYENLVTTRAKLFDRVWASPMRSIAPDFGVTDVGLKKSVGVSVSRLLPRATG